jgi:hypothetical protein
MTRCKVLVAALSVLMSLGAGAAEAADATADATAGATAAGVVDAMIAAHGGMAAWKDAPTVSFTDTWYTGGSTEGRTARVMVEQGPRRAVIDMAGSDARMAWDGTRAWSVNWTSPVPPRFLALLDYYFLNLPWLVKDPGVILGEPGTGTLWDDPTEYTTVRVTFEPGTGDTPDDYYVLYIDPGTRRLAACEYIVTYADLLPPGVEHTPPHILVYDEFETVDGLVVPTRFTIYLEDHTVYARCDVTDWSFSKPFDPSRLEMPAGGKVDSSRPVRDGDR